MSGCNLPRLPQQPTGIPRLGYLGIGMAMPNSLLLEAFRDGLRDLGYVEGQNLLIEYRFLDGRLEQAPGLAAELASLDVALIVTAGVEATIAAKNATATTPIVGAVLGPDPVEAGVVASLARPGGNVTGLSAVSSETVAKLLQLLKEEFPGIRRVAVLRNPNNAAKLSEYKVAQSAAPLLGLELVSVEVRGDADFDGAFEAIVGSGADSLLVFQEPLTASNSARIAAFAARQRLPAIYQIRLFTDAGGLMSYGVDSVEQYRHAATYVDKILKGAKPADLPIEQPTKYDFVINLKTAQALGLTIPPSVLLQATEVIQ